MLFCIKKKPKYSNFWNNEFPEFSRQDTHDRVRLQTIEGEHMLTDKIYFISPYRIKVEQVDLQASKRGGYRNFSLIVCYYGIYYTLLYINLTADFNL